MSDFSPISASKQMIAISGKNFLDFSKTLKVGDVLQGKVLTVLGDGKYGVNFRGHHVIAESVNKFDAGQVIQGQVKDLGSKVVMRLVDSDTLVGVLPKAEFAKALRQLSVNPSLTSLIQDSSLLLGELSKQNSAIGKLLSKFLSLLDVKGQDFESFVRNLFSKKGNKKLSKLLMQLAQELEQSDLDIKAKSHLKRFMHDMLKNLEAQAYINKDSNAAGMHAYLQIPFFIGDKANNLELKIFDAKHEDPDANGLRINLDFELSNLGAMSFILNLEENSLDISIFSEKEEVMDLISVSNQGFLNSLKALGYSVRSFNSYLYESDQAKTLGIDQKKDFYSVRRIDTVA